MDRLPQRVLTRQIRINKSFKRGNSCGKSLRWRLAALGVAVAAVLVCLPASAQPAEPAGIPLKALTDGTGRFDNASLTLVAYREVGRGVELLLEVTAFDLGVDGDVCVELNGQFAGCSTPEEALQVAPLDLGLNTIRLWLRPDLWFTATTATPQPRGMGVAGGAGDVVGAGQAGSGYLLTLVKQQDGSVVAASFKDRVVSEKYWQSICPAMHINSRWPSVGGQNLYHREAEVPVEELDRLRRSVSRDGYFHTRPLSWQLPVSWDEMADCALRIRQAGWPAVFSFMFDEFWMVVARSGGLARAMLGPDTVQIVDVWIHIVDKAGGETGNGELAESKGWSAHRDRAWLSIVKGTSPPVSGPPTLNFWVPLTEATADNGCMHVIPKSRDSAFTLPGGGRSAFSQIGRDTGLGKLSLQDVRALPAKPGEVLGWDGEVVHWGGRAHSTAKHRRISMALDFSESEDMGNALSKDKRLHLPIGFMPGLATRLGIIASSVKTFLHHGDGLPSLTKKFVLEELYTVSIDHYNNHEAGDDANRVLPGSPPPKRGRPRHAMGVSAQGVVDSE